MVHPPKEGNFATHLWLSPMLCNVMKVIVGWESVHPCDPLDTSPSSGAVVRWCALEGKCRVQRRGWTGRK